MNAALLVVISLNILLIYYIDGINNKHLRINCDDKDFIVRLMTRDEWSFRGILIIIKEVIVEMN